MKGEFVRDKFVVGVGRDARVVLAISASRPFIDCNIKNLAMLLESFRAIFRAIIFT